MPTTTHQLLQAIATPSPLLHVTTAHKAQLANFLEPRATALGHSIRAASGSWQIPTSPSLIRRTDILLRHAHALMQGDFVLSHRLASKQVPRFATLHDLCAISNAISRAIKAFRRRFIGPLPNGAMGFVVEPTRSAWMQKHH